MKEQTTGQLHDFQLNIAPTPLLVPPQHPSGPGCGLLGGPWECLVGVEAHGIQHLQPRKSHIPDRPAVSTYVVRDPPTTGRAGGLGRELNMGSNLRASKVIKAGAGLAGGHQRLFTRRDRLGDVGNELPDEIIGLGQGATLCMTRIRFGGPKKLESHRYAQGDSMNSNLDAQVGVAKFQQSLCGWQK